MQRTNELHIPYPRFIECIRVNVLCRIAQKETTAIIYMKETTRFTHHLLFSSTKTRFVKKYHWHYTVIFYLSHNIFNDIVTGVSDQAESVCQDSGQWSQVRLACGGNLVTTGDISSNVFYVTGHGSSSEENRIHQAGYVRNTESEY